MIAAQARGEDPGTIDPPDEYPDRPAAGVVQPWLEEVLAYRPTEEEIRRIEAQENERDRLMAADPLVLDARDYGTIADRIARALQGDLAGGDAIILAALETIERHALCIGAKTWRAVSGRIRTHLDDDEDVDEDLQSDANGSAKITRLMVQESREAWLVLMQVGRAAADGVPTKMIERLDRLDRDLERRFPRAMEFIRPGFDEESCDSANERSE